MIVIRSAPLLKVYCRFLDHGKKYFVDYREITLRLRQLYENFVIYLWNGFLITLLNVNGALFLLSLYTKARGW